jgi:predicted methyltransferase
MNTNNGSLPDYIRDAVDSPRRPDVDKERDEIRKIAQLMVFFDIQPGQRVADLMASRGYIAGLLAEIVGEDGIVYSQNSAALLNRFKGKNPITKRIETHGLTNMVAVTAELEEIGFPEPLDVMFSFMYYHDTVWVGTDRARMNAAIFQALKPGGIFAVVDHHTKPGAGVGQAQELHRIERSVVVDEVTAAGFELEDESDLLENPDDPLDVMVFDKSIKDHTHKFVLKFRKPA